MKKFLTIVVLMLGIHQVNSQNFNVDGIQYVVIDNGVNAEVSLGGNYTGDIVIPATVSYGGNSYPVTSIGEGAFQSSWQLTSVFISGNVTVIHKKAFSKCSALKSITILQPLDSIGFGAFENCTSLLSFSLPFSGTGTVIGENAFFNCSKMTTVSLPNSVTEIGTSAFAYCSSLASVDIPFGLKEIKSGTFTWCSSLTSVHIAISVETLGANAFSDCSALETIEFPSSLKTIENGAFYNCKALSYITIPSSVMVIGSQAFYNCIKLNSVYVNHITPIAITDDCFNNLPYSSILYVPDDTEIDYKHKQGWKNFFTIKGKTTIFYYLGIDYRTISDNEVEVFGNDDLFLATNLVEIPATVDYNSQIYKVVSIRDNACFAWNEPSKISLPGGIKTIGSNAFASCTNLHQINTPNVVTTIGDFAFSDCTNLNDFTIPASVTSIGAMSLNNCFAIDKIWTQVADPKNLALGVDVFKNMKFPDCNVFVPKGSVPLYENAPQWSQFKGTIQDKPAPSINRIPKGMSRDFNNFIEFDYSGYFNTHSVFDATSAYEFYLLSISQTKLSKLNVFPTMCRDYFQVVGVNEKTTIEVVDLNGKVIESRTINEPTKISLNSKTKGIYIVRVRSAKTDASFRIVKI